MGWVNATILLAGAVLFLAAVYFLTPTFVRIWSGQPGMDGRGQFGDQFGAFNTLLTGLAFVMLLLGYLQQKRELKETLKAYDEERRARVQTARDAQFEMMMRVTSETRDRLSMTDQSSIRYQGADVLKQVAEAIRGDTGPVEGNKTAKTAFSMTGPQHADRGRKIDIERVRDDPARAYEALIMPYARPVIGPYLLLVYACLSQMDADGRDQRDAMVRLFVASLGLDAAVIVAYQSLVFPKLHALVDKFDVLRHLSAGDLAAPQHRVRFASRFVDDPEPFA